jgi:hypothetical protein
MRFVDLRICGADISDDLRERGSFSLFRQNTAAPPPSHRLRHLSCFPFSGSLNSSPLKHQIQTWIEFHSFYFCLCPHLSSDIFPNTMRIILPQFILSVAFLSRTSRSVYRTAVPKCARSAFGRRLSVGLFALAFSIGSALESALLFSATPRGRVYPPPVPLRVCARRFRVCFRRARAACWPLPFFRTAPFSVLWRAR